MASSKNLRTKQVIYDSRNGAARECLYLFFIGYQVLLRGLTIYSAFVYIMYCVTYQLNLDFLDFETAEALKRTLHF